MRRERKTETKRNEGTGGMNLITVVVNRQKCREEE